MPKPRLALIGSGGEQYRGYALEAIARRCDIVLVSPAPPSWEQTHILEYRPCDLHDLAAMTKLIAEIAPDGVLTFLEPFVVDVAEAAAAAGVPHTSAAAIRCCKNKEQLRQRLAQTGVSQVKFGIAGTLTEAGAVADDIGYPLVVKPHALGASRGVVRVDDAENLPAAFDVARGSQEGAVLMEEFLEGPEFSVDCITWEGRTTPLAVAEKHLAFPPYFEEWGHVVPAPAQPDMDDALELVSQVHALVGLDRIATHSEFKLTPRGPRIIEVNARLGGDLIPYLGYLASGVDITGAAADVAVGRAPDLTPTRSRVASVAMFYPDRDVELKEVTLAEEGRVPGLEEFEQLNVAGAELRLPPRGFIGRAAYAIVTDDTYDGCMRAVRAVRENVTITGGPLEAI